MKRPSAIAIATLAACSDGGGTAIDPLRPNTCLDAAALAFCADFDRIDQTAAPFGLGELLGGELTEVVVIAENGNRGLAMRSEGATFGQSGARPVGSATRATVRALIEQPSAAPGKSLTLGLLLLDGSAPDGRQVWVVANADGTLAVDALGESIPTTGRIEQDRFTQVSIDATWMPGTTQVNLAVSAAAAGADLVPILEGHVLELAPPPEVSAAIAIISLEPGARHVVFDNVTLDLDLE